MSARSKNAPRVHRFADASLAALQLRDKWSGGVQSPARKLAAAVLGAAVADVQKYRYASRHSRQYREAYQWVDAVDREWPFSFVNICEALRLSPEALRMKLLGPRCGEAAQEHAA